jgi:hypothetical protein
MNWNESFPGKSTRKNEKLPASSPYRSIRGIYRSDYTLPPAIWQDVLLNFFKL